MATHTPQLRHVLDELQCTATTPVEHRIAERIHELPAADGMDLLIDMWLEHPADSIEFRTAVRLLPAVCAEVLQVLQS